MAKRKRPEGGGGGVDEEQQPDALIGLTITFDPNVEEQDAPRGGTSQVLPVEELSQVADGEWENAMQYLYHVRQQADKCPPVVRVDNPYATPIPTAAYPGDTAMDSVASTSYQKPSEQTRQAFVEQFKALRQSIAEGYAPEVLDTWYYPIPGNDMAQWRNYINGKKPKTIPIASKAENVVHPALDSAAHNAEMKSRPKEPSTDLLKSIPSNLLLTVLSYFTEWISERFDPPSTSFVPRRAANKAAVSNSTTKPRTILPDLDSQWIFSLLSGIDSVLTSEDVYTLRELSKTCLKAIRLLPDLHKGKQGAEQELEDQLTGLWMIVAVIGDVWGQRDLWDNL